MSRFEPVQEVIKDLCLLQNDLQQLMKGKYLSVAKDVFYDLQLDILKNPIRERFKINKRTNTIDLPVNFLQLSSVNIQAPNGVFYPVWLNDKINDDVPTVEAAKDCACAYKCGYTLCNTIKGYEAVQTTKTDSLPNGNPISFNCIDRKGIMGNFFYAELQYPKRIYTDGVWTDTILYTEQKQLCTLELDRNGCVKDTKENIDAVCNACGFKDEYLNSANNGVLYPIGGDANSYYGNQKVNTWIYKVNDKLDWFLVQCGNRFSTKNCDNIFNITEEGNRLIFPRNFGFDSVIVRYYAQLSLLNLQIPIIAKPVFMKGLQYFVSTFNDKKQNVSQIYGREYANMKFGLLQELNKYRMAELRMITTPPTYVPSYYPYYKDQTWGVYQD